MAICAMQYGNMIIQVMSTCLCTYSVKWCNLDAIIYNKITSIVNVIRLKLFTLISIVYKYY